eukprot:SAG11_NODE_31551_length_291_cov_0.526042_1_plen_44_part_00
MDPVGTKDKVGFFDPVAATTYGKMVPPTILPWVVCEILGVFLV